MNEDTKTPLGVRANEGETYFWTPGGLLCCIENFASNPAGTSYVRFIDPADNGKEIAYWSVDEWRESEEQAVEVMGAIMGAMMGGCRE